MAASLFCDELHEAQVPIDVQGVEVVGITVLARLLNEVPVAIVVRDKGDDKHSLWSHSPKSNNPLLLMLVVWQAGVDVNTSCRLVHRRDHEKDPDSLPYEFEICFISQDRLIKRTQKFIALPAIASWVMI